MIRRNITTGVSPLNILQQEVIRTTLLSADGERELGRRARGGDMAARSQFAAANLRLVFAIARSHTGWGVDLEDLIGAGQIGLMHAVDRFDPDRGTRFSTYASWYIHREIDHAIEDQICPIRVPRENQRWLASIQTGRRVPIRVPSPKVAAATLAAIGTPPVRIDEDEPDTVQVPDPMPGPLDALIEAERREILAGALRTLDPRSALVVRLNFGLDGTSPLTLEQIGKQLGVTRERVRQIRIRAIDRLYWACGGEMD